MWIHLTARMPPGAPELTREDTGAWLWKNLRAVFPCALANVAMPNHLHLLPDEHEREGAPHRLARMLGHFCRAWRIRGSFEVAPPKELRNVSALAREIRYIALNPCRAGLTRCPLAWPWSTHRDVVGAIADPWVTAARLAEAVSWPEHSFVERFHHYVSGDPHASVIGTPLPVPAVPSFFAELPLRTIAEAVAATMRVPVEAIRVRGSARALFVTLAREHGWDSAMALARACACTTRTIRNLSQGIDPAQLRAARLALGEERLRALPPSRA